jgi:hypothetical protein
MQYNGSRATGKAANHIQISSPRATRGLKDFKSHTTHSQTMGGGGQQNMQMVPFVFSKDGILMTKV